VAEANYRGDPFGRRALDGLVHVNFAQMSPPADGGLISAQERDVAAIYRTFAPAARSMAEVILRDRHLAEDAVQDAFLSLWLLGTAYKPDAHRRDALVRTLVHRRAVDVLRSRRSGISTVPLDEVTGSLVERSLGPEDIVVEADRASGGSGSRCVVVTSQTPGFASCLLGWSFAR